jgi:hypothetical protein
MAMGEIDGAMERGLLEFEKTMIPFRLQRNPCSPSE